MTRLLAAGATALFLALLAPATASTSAQQTRPFTSTCVAVVDDPLSPNVTVRGTCRTTHLGLDSFVASHTVIPTGLPDASGVVPIAAVGGRATHVAANGDTLLTAYEGVGRVYLLTGLIEFELTGVFIGGTGRFAGASGTSRIEGVVEDGVTRYKEMGSISY